ncbi:hypothetical protein GMMP15_1030042 [Candidatus Magnetomoraceae bacterium gMMP-15]
MNELPPSVIDFFVSLIIRDRSPAYLSVEKNGCLADWDGRLEYYGIKNLRKNDHIEKQVFFLKGFFPLNEKSLFLPCIQTEKGVPADIHILSHEKRNLVILLDASQDRIQRSLFQQKGNELRLLQKKISNIINHNIGKKITKELFREVL